MLGCGCIYTTVPGEEEEGKEIYRVYNFPNGFCSEVTEMMVLDLSTPRRELLLHTPPSTPTCPLRRPFAQREGE